LGAESLGGETLAGGLAEALDFDVAMGLGGDVLAGFGGVLEAGLVDAFLASTLACLAFAFAGMY
jgi:hypothetical protein